MSGRPKTRLRLRDPHHKSVPPLIREFREHIEKWLKDVQKIQYSDDKQLKIDVDVLLEWAAGYKNLTSRAIGEISTHLEGSSTCPRDIELPIEFSTHFFFSV